MPDKETPLERLPSVQEAIKKDPDLETVKIRYSPGGSSESSFIVNGKELNMIVSRFQVDIKAQEIPKITIELDPLCFELEADLEMRVKYPDPPYPDIPDKIALKAYEILKERFKDK